MVVRSLIRWLVILVVAAIAIWLAFRSVVWIELYEAGSGLQYKYVPLAVVILQLGILARTERWRLLLDRHDGFRRRHLFSSLLIGYLGIAILPFRLGEVARVYAARRLAGVPVADALAALFLEHILDLGTLILLLFWQWPQLKSYEWIQEIYLVGIGLFVVSACLLVGVVVFSSKVLVFVAVAEKTFPQWGRNLELTAAIGIGIGSIRRLKNPKLLLILSFWSVVTWGFACSFNGAFLYALGIGEVLKGSVISIIFTNFGIERKDHFVFL